MRLITCTILCSIVALARSAIAAEPASFSSHTGTVPAWSIDRVEPPAPARGSAQLHDGFYLRASAGSGLINVEYNPEPGYDDQTENAAGLSLDLLAGASPLRGAAFGGALLLDLAPSMPLAGSAPEANGALGIGLIGPFADVFPDPRLGWHFGGVLGFAALELETVDSHHHRMYGFGGALWAGNEFWIGDEWSMGGALRFAHTQTRGDAGSVDFNAFTFSASLMLTLAYH
jgi:hypothetical protein